MKTIHTPITAEPVVFIDQSSGAPRVIISGTDARVAFDLSREEAVKIATAIIRACWDEAPPFGAEEKEIVMPKRDEWIEWHGGDRPVRPEALVEYRMRSGPQDCDMRAAGALRWHHLGMSGADIVAYRVVMP